MRELGFSYFVITTSSAPQLGGFFAARCEHNRGASPAGLRRDRSRWAV